MDADRPAAKPVEIPTARTVRQRGISPIWLVPIVALIFVGWLAVRHHQERGPRITIHFREATGLEAGKSELQFRGAIIGRVAEIRLAENLEEVIVAVDLQRSAEKVARADSQFWIVQPEVTAERIRGLGAIVSGNYIEVKPGSGAKKADFRGMDQPPILGLGSEGLQIVLLAPELHSVSRGSAVTYRGINVGQVTSCEMETNAQAVRIHVNVERGYASLVRMNSKFWNAGGLDFDLGWRGVGVRAQSFKAAVGGAIAFATPTAAAAPARDGDFFRLYEKPEDEWRKWAPEIIVSPKEHPGSNSSEPSKRSPARENAP